MAILASSGLILIILVSCNVFQVSELQARAPRILLQTIANVTSKYPSATVEGLMVACVFSGSLQHPQSELLAHLFTSCLSAEHQTQFLTIVLSKTFDWNDSMVDLLTSILETQVSNYEWRLAYKTLP